MKRMSEEEVNASVREFTDKAANTLAPKISKAKLWLKRIAAVFFLLLCIPFFLGGLTIAGVVILVIGLYFLAGGFLGAAMEGLAVTLIFALAGIGMVLIGYNAYQKGVASQKWPSTQGKVISSQIEKSTSTTGTGSNKRTTTHTYAKVAYAYNVAGQSYTGHRVQFGQASEDPHAIVARYAQGKTITVYYDPEMPDQAVLIPGANSMFSMAFMGLGAIFFVFGVFATLKRRKSRMALANA